MKKIEKINMVLSLALIITTTVAIYALLSKGSSVPAVTMVIQEKDYNYEDEDNYGNSNFWDNYPFLVMLAAGKKLDSTIQLKKSNTSEGFLLTDFASKKENVFFRCIEIDSHQGLMIRP